MKNCACYTCNEVTGAWVAHIDCERSDHKICEHGIRCWSSPWGKIINRIKGYDPSLGYKVKP